MLAPSPKFEPLASSIAWSRSRTRVTVASGPKISLSNRWRSGSVSSIRVGSKK